MNRKRAILTLRENVLRLETFAKQTTGAEERQDGICSREKEHERFLEDNNLDRLGSG